MKKQKNDFQLAHDILHEKIRARKKTMTSRSFKGFGVFIHHEDGSYFIFQDALLWEALIEVGKKNYVFNVVFSRYIEPQIFYPSDLKACHVYGDAEEKTWEKAKAYRPRKVHKPAHDYLKKSGLKLTCKDFTYEGILIEIGWHTTMYLTHKKIEMTGNTIYIFTEHHGYYAFKKKDIHLSVKFHL